MNKYSELDEIYEKPIDFLGMFIRYISHWKWVVVSLFVCLSVALIYLKFTLPSYEVTTSILLKDDQKGSGSAEMNAFKEMGLFTQKNNVDNELEVLKTRTLVEQVVRELGTNANYTHIATLPIISKLGTAVGFTNLGKYNERILSGNESPIIVRLPDVILDTLNDEIKFEILVHPSGVYEFSGKYLGRTYNVKSSISDSQVKLPFGVVNTTRGSLRPKEDMIVGVTLQSPESKAKEVIAQLKMELTSKTTSVVIITYKTSNINLGKSFLNKFIEVYNREDLNDKTIMANNTAQFIDDRLMTLSRELGDVETRVENYKQVQGLTDITSESNMFIQQTGDFAQRRLEVETQLAIVSDIDDYMHRKENLFQLIPASSGISSSGLSELINNYNKFILQRNRLSRIASSSNQAMIDLTNQIESMFSTVQSSVRNEKNNLKIAKRDLLSRNNENAARIRAIPRQEREYTEIKRQQGVKEALFLFLLQKKEEKYVNLSMVEPIAKIIDNVRNTGGPVSPNKLLILIISFIIGLFIPIVGIKIGDLLRFQISTKEELEELTDVPILGEIPISNEANNVFIKENNTDSFTELIRLLRTNLLFVMDSSDKKIINIVSSISGEGKTFATINLAMSLALLDKKVLIIGLDVRKPKLAEYLGIESKSGITLYLTGHLKKDQLVNPSGIHPNLSVILAGPIPPNPNELLAKPALGLLISELRAQYDYIIIDTAPVLVVSDCFLLNRFADVNLYLVRADYTPKKNIEDATNLFKLKKLKNMYFVLNGTDRTKFSYRYGSGKKYGYGYVNKQDNKYGYGNENVKKKKAFNV
ncbi:MAG: polysaccharide biosynthesis tyrosine autokinase [Paludibacter sp.]|nr:polysaccharide biosynthesis tyrosine autokinase [Paludibacter sp.]